MDHAVFEPGLFCEMPDSTQFIIWKMPDFGIWNWFTVGDVQSEKDVVEVLIYCTVVLGDAESKTGLMCEMTD